MEKLEPTMFREYDIRGRVKPGELDEDSFAAIIWGYGSFLANRGIDRVVVGYDNRPHSVQFSEIACSLLKQRGFTLYNVGLSLSPVVYFAQYAFNAPGAVMITASHNPLGWGGVKLANGLSQTLGTEDIKEVYQLARLYKPECAGKAVGTVNNVDVRTRYLEDIVERVSSPSCEHNGLRVLVDGANGAAGVFIYELFQALGCTTFQLNCDPDDSYPHYFPNPSSPAARQRMKELVAHPYLNCDIALAFDGDGDRLGAVSNKGEDIWSDRLLMVLAAEVLAKCPGAPIVYDVKCTRALGQAVESLGGKGVMCATGHSHVKSKLRQVKAPLAGERSGHIFLAPPFGYGYDDALLAAGYLVTIMAQSGKDIDQLLTPFPRYCTTQEIALACTDRDKYNIVDRVREVLAKEWGEERLVTVNGVRLELDQGWCLLRASSNLPELVMVAEGQDAEGRKAMTNIIYHALREVGYNFTSAAKDKEL